MLLAFCRIAFARICDTTHGGTDHCRERVVRETATRPSKMPVTRTSKMLAYVNYRMRVTIVDGRQIVGRFMAFDRHMNLVLSDAEEFRKLPPKKGLSEEERQTRRVLGFVLLRGEEVVSLTVEGPPPSEDRRGAEQTAPAGPGSGRSAGRGLPGGALNAAAPGLQGPVTGVGGPSAAHMRPQFAAAPAMRPPGAPPPGSDRGCPPPGSGPGCPPREACPPPGSGPAPRGRRRCNQKEAKLSIECFLFLNRVRRSRSFRVFSSPRRPSAHQGLSQPYRST